MSGYVYFIKPVGQDGPIKIGSSSNVGRRLEQLAAWSPYPLQVLVAIPGDGKLERNIHECFADAYTHREWFTVTPKLKAFVSALMAGVPLAEAIDLNDRVGPLPYKKRGGSQWPEHTKLYMSLLNRIRHASNRAEKATGRPVRFLPSTLDRIFEQVHGGRMPTKEELVCINAAIADPVTYFLTWEELERQRKAA
jgi:hypothetical protein